MLQETTDRFSQLQFEHDTQACHLVQYRTSLAHASEERAEYLASSIALHAELQELKLSLSKQLADRDAEIARLRAVAAEQAGVTVLVPMQVMATLEADKMAAALQAAQAPHEPTPHESEDAQAAPLPVTPPTLPPRRPRRRVTSPSSRYPSLV